MFTRRGFLGVLGGVGAAMALGGCDGSGGGKTPLMRAGEGKKGAEGGIDRLAVLRRHSPRVTKVDPAAVLSVGNGNFAFNVDCTGLQTLHEEYKVIPLATLAHWAWHSNPVPAGVDVRSLKYKEWEFHGRTVPYATSSTGQKEVFDYLRENQHMLNLGRVGLLLDGRTIKAAEVGGIDQTLDLHTGVITSRFKLAGEEVEVVTCAHGAEDGIGVRVTSGLVAKGRLAVLVEFGYGAATFAGDGAVWDQPDKHQSAVTASTATPVGGRAHIARTVDATTYGVRVAWGSGAALKEGAKHQFLVTGKGESLELVVQFDRKQEGGGKLYGFEEARAASAGAWGKFWENGAALDLGNCTDGRAPELERRIVLSQYLTMIHCAGEYPSQETGLLCNSWYGKFHLEMHWWHSVHFTVWGRGAQCFRSMPFYWEVLESSKARAKQQGFAGTRWPKMTDPSGADSPSPVGPMLLWQQPHPIYYAELAWRAAPTRETLMKWREIVVATAEFMASFAQWDEGRKEYVLGPAIKTVSENNPTETTINPTWELTAWRMGLRMAQTWLVRMGEPRNAGWDKVLKGLAKAPVREGVYQFQENIGGNLDSFSKEWAWEHPAMLGAYGVLPGDGIDPEVMRATVKKLRATWNFSKVWGWDFPMAALCAARSGEPELAVDFLTMEAPMNRYLFNGVNFQRDNVPAYFPGNGGILSAVGMMSGGWEGGPKTRFPGWPKDGKWDVRAEGFGVWI